jgi:hypothetical protein
LRQRQKEKDQRKKDNDDGKKNKDGGKNPAGTKACRSDEVLLKESTPDGRLVTRCLPGPKQQSCGSDEVLLKETTPDGRLVTRCLKK